MPVEWDGDAFMRDMDAANEAGLDGAAIVGVSRVKEVLGRLGAPSSKTARRLLKRGRKSLIVRDGLISAVKLPRKLTDNYVRASVFAQQEAAYGLVDAPGGYPRKRTGNLQRSITHDGLTGEAKKEKRRIGADMSADAYAAVHEFGNSKIPARPYLRRTLLRNKSAMFDKYAEIVKGALGI